jgi:hypothetical protein
MKIESFAMESRTDVKLTVKLNDQIFIWFKYRIPK